MLPFFPFLRIRWSNPLISLADVAASSFYTGRLLSITIGKV